VRAPLDVLAQRDDLGPERFDLGDERLGLLVHDLALFLLRASCSSLMAFTMMPMMRLSTVKVVTTMKEMKNTQA
jgi:hypothetical protein